MRLGVHMIRILIVALAFVWMMSVNPVSAQQPSGSNPTAMSVTEEQLFLKLHKLQGRITIPDQQLATLEQPQGRTYRAFHEVALPLDRRHRRPRHDSRNRGVLLLEGPHQDAARGAYRPQDPAL